MSIADATATSSIFLSIGRLLPFDQARIGAKLAPTWKAANIMDLVEHR